MSRHKKRQFHCNHCGSPCTIYRKGKGHRVLVCPHCGVIATNPTLAGSILKGVVSAVPVVGGAASSIIGDIQAKHDAKKTPEVHTHRGLSNFERALMLELAERGH